MKTNAAEERIEEEAPLVDQDVVQVPVPDDDDDDDVQQGQESAQSRQDRRSSYKKLKETRETERAQWTEKESKWEQRFQEQERQLAELRGSVNARPVQQPSRQEPDPQQQAQQESQWYQEQMALASAAIQNAPKGTPQEVLDGYVQRWHQLNDARMAAFVRAQVAQQPQQSQQAPNFHLEMLRMQHPKIFSDDALNLEARAEAVRLMRSKGERAISYETALEANERVYARHGLGKKQQAPSDNDRQKLAGTSGRAGASGGQGNTVGMSKADRRTAIAYYSGDHPLNHLSDDEKIARYAKRIKSKPDQP